MPALARLRAFEAAARRGSFTLAAEELHLTASAISHQVRALEAHLGRALFERRHRGVMLSSEGERLRDSLARAFDAIEAACTEVRLAAHEQVIALHCAPSLAIKWLGPRLRDFAQAHPGVHVRLSTGADVPDLAAEREVDLVLAYADGRARTGTEVTALGEEQIAPLAAPELLRRAAAGSGSKDPATQMQQLPLIDATLSPLPWSRWFELQGLPVPRGPRTAFDRAAMAIAAAADGLGVALESTRLAARELERGDLLIVGAKSFKPMRQSVHFLHRRQGRARPAVQSFVSWLMQQARTRDRTSAQKRSAKA